MRARRWLCPRRGRKRRPRDRARDIVGAPLRSTSWRHQTADFDAVPVDQRERGWQLDQEAEEEWGDSAAFPFSLWRRDDHGWGGPPVRHSRTESGPRRPVRAPAAVLDPWERPTPTGVHGWASALQEGRAATGRFEFAEPQWLDLRFPGPMAVRRLELYLNWDLDRHLANVWYLHPPGMRAMPTLIADLDVEVSDAEGRATTVATVRGNHQRRCAADVEATIQGLRVTAYTTNGVRYASITDIRVWPL